MAYRLDSVRLAEDFFHTLSSPGCKTLFFVGGIYSIRSSKDMATVSPTVFPIAWRMSARTGSFMCAITQSHERTAKGVPFDFAPDLYQAAGSKELAWTRPDDIGPTTLLGTLL